MEAITLEKKTIQRILSGEISFFSQIVDSHHKKIRSYISKRCSNKTDTEDIIQEIFIAAFNNLSQYDSTKPFSAWIFGIARNKSNDHYRKVQRIPIPTESIDNTDSTIVATSGSVQLSNHSQQDTPASILATREQSNQFWEESKRILTEEQFTAIWLKYQSEFNVSEISIAMKISLSNTKIHLFRARKKLATSPLINQLAP